MKDLARAIKKTAELHEESYDAKAAGIASKKHEFLDFNKFYTKTLNQCAMEAAENEQMAHLINIVLFTAWNDALGWADEVLKDEL